MTLTKIKPIFYIAGSIILIILVVLFTSILFQKEETSTKTNPFPTPKNKSIALKQTDSFQSELAKLANLLPLKSTNYSVEYNQSLNLILAKINPSSNDDYYATKKQIEQQIK